MTLTVGETEEELNSVTTYFTTVIMQPKYYHTT